MADGTVASGLTSAVIEVAVSRGAPREPLLAASGLDVSPPPERVPIARLYDVWELALRGTRDASLPVRVGAAARFDRYGALGMVLYVSASVDAALRRLARYHDVLTDSGHWQLRRDDARGIATWHRAASGRLGERAANEQVLASFITIARQITSSFAPLAVHLRHVPPDPAALAAHAGAPVTAGADADAIVFPASWLDERPSGSDPHVEQFLVAQIAQALGPAEPATSLASQAARVVIERLADGAPTLRDLATVLAIPERTLRRRLAAERTTFERVLESVQRERALTLLARDHPVAQVALAVGFADASAFGRAFRRWTGKTPTEARRG